VGWSGEGWETETLRSPRLRQLATPQVAEGVSAIDHWLVARDKFKMQPCDESQRDYEATLNDLGVAWGERYPEDADTPEAFQWYRLGLIAPEEE
jgi:hypothetical protein